MAKLGEGDDRWIVEEKKDGTNVHGWHWQEKNCLPWSKARLGELLEGLAVVQGEGAVWLKVTQVTSVEGEAYVNIRKGKKIPGYELEIKAAWEGEIREGGAESGAVISKANGTVHLPYVADENSDEDPEIKILTASEGPATTNMRQLMLSKGRKVVLEKVVMWRTELHNGGPGGDGPAPEPPLKAEAPTAAAPKKEEKKRSDGSGTISLSEKFICRAGDIFEAYTNPQRVMAFTQSAATCEPVNGGNFSMFDNSVHGENVELVPGEKIVQKWRFANWEEGVFSTVTITFKEPEPGNTTMTLVQTGIPYEDKFGNHNVIDQTEHGWKNLIFGRMRTVFGFGC